VFPLEVTEAEVTALDEAVENSGIGPSRENEQMARGVKFVDKQERFSFSLHFKTTRT
jgi:hypothetical protein